MGIHKNEPLLHQRFLVVEDHAVQVDKRLGIDEHANIAKLKDPVAVAWLRIEPDVIAQSGTPPALHAQAQSTLFGRNAFLGHRALHLAQGFLRDLNTLGRRGLRYGFS